MKDSRVSVWTNTTTHATGTTSNTGPTIDLFSSGATLGGTTDGTNEGYGIGVEILQTCTSGTAQVTTWEWRVSSDNFVAVDQPGGFIGLGTMATSVAPATVARIKTNLETRYRYVRLKASNAGAGTSTSVAYAEDFGGFTGTIAISNA